MSRLSRARDHLRQLTDQPQTTRIDRISAA
jgi:hypothetical protein